MVPNWLLVIFSISDVVQQNPLASGIHVSQISKIIANKLVYAKDRCAGRKRSKSRRLDVDAVNPSGDKEIDAQVFWKVLVDSYVPFVLISAI